MKKQQVNESIKRCLDEWTPDCYETVANATVAKMPFQDTVTEQIKNETIVPKTNNSALRLAPVFALLLLALISSLVYIEFFQIRGTVGLDVNPSVQIDVNRQNRVVAIKPLNADAVPIIRGIGYKQVRLEFVVRALIGSMYQSGYLQDPESAILVSVESNDSSLAEELKRKVVIEVNELISLDSSQVYSQIVPDEQLTSRAEAYGVSFGVLNLAIQAQKLHPAFGLEELFVMPLSRLYQLAFDAEKDDDASTKSEDGGVETNTNYIYHLPLINSPAIEDQQLQTPTQPNFDVLWGDDDDGSGDDDDWDYDDDDDADD